MNENQAAGEMKYVSDHYILRENGISFESIGCRVELFIMWTYEHNVDADVKQAPFFICSDRSFKILDTFFTTSTGAHRVVTDYLC